MAFTLLGSVAFADGPADNRPDNVRPVPRKGAIISQDVRDELEQGITKLGAEIDALRDQLKNKPALLALSSGSRMRAMLIWAM